MAIYSETHNILFIMNPRTGCTALGKMMREQMNGRYVPARDILDEKGNIRIQRKHTTVQEIAGNALLAPEVLSRVHIFTSVRNPFDSLVSLWTKKRHAYAERKKTDPNSFVNKLPGYADDMEFIQTHSFSEWIIQFFGSKDTATVNLKHLAGTHRHLRFETLQDDLDRMLKDLGIAGSFTIGVHNVTEKREPDYRAYYTDAARAVVEEKFARDLRRLNYAF